MSVKLGRLLVLRQNNYDKVSFRDRIYFSMLLVFVAIVRITQK